MYLPHSLFPDYSPNFWDVTNGGEKQNLRGCCAWNQSFLKLLIDLSSLVFRLVLDYESISFIWSWSGLSFRQCWIWIPSLAKHLDIGSTVAVENEVELWFPETKTVSFISPMKHRGRCCLVIGGILLRIILVHATRALHPWDGGCCCVPSWRLYSLSPVTLIQYSIMEEDDIWWVSIGISYKRHHGKSRSMKSNNMWVQQS